VDCRKRGGLKTFEEELPVFGPLQFEPGYEPIVEVVRRIDKEEAARRRDDKPKLLKCEGCGKYLLVTYDVYLYVGSTEKGQRVSYCSICRKQKGMPSIEDDVPGFGAFQFDLEGSRTAPAPGATDAVAQTPAVTVRRRTAEEIDREAEEWLGSTGRWDLPIDEAVTDELVKAAIRRKGIDARRKAAECGENPKLLECRDCRKYFAFPYVMRVYRELIDSGQKTAAELAHCVTCRKRAAMKTLDAELPGLGPFLYDPGDSRVAVARERELSEARRHELKGAWAAGELVREREHPPAGASGSW
jgi:hypothetical protein